MQDQTLTESTIERLHEIYTQVKDKNSGTRILFTDPSGTGTTLAAFWLSAQLEIPLYRVKVASVLSKYISETEQNLDDVFRKAAQSESILFIDEADALFGKRIKPPDENYRYAKIENHFLLQRLDEYPGLVILTSNKKENIDERFIRAMDYVEEIETEVQPEINPWKIIIDRLRKRLRKS